jgi:hypothetical protein
MTPAVNFALLRRESTSHAKIFVSAMHAPPPPPCDFHTEQGQGPRFSVPDTATALSPLSTPGVTYLDPALSLHEAAVKDGDLLDILYSPAPAENMKDLKNKL